MGNEWTRHIWHDIVFSLSPPIDRSIWEWMNEWKRERETWTLLTIWQRVGKWANLWLMCSILATITHQYNWVDLQKYGQSEKWQRVLVTKKHILRRTINSKSLRESPLSGIEQMSLQIKLTLDLGLIFVFVLWSSVFVVEWHKTMSLLRFSHYTIVTKMWIELELSNGCELTILAITFPIIHEMMHTQSFICI